MMREINKDPMPKYHTMSITLRSISGIMNRCRCEKTYQKQCTLIRRDETSLAGSWKQKCFPRHYSITAIARSIFEGPGGARGEMFRRKSSSRRNAKTLSMVQVAER